MKFIYLLLPMVVCFFLLGQQGLSLAQQQDPAHTEEQEQEETCELCEFLLGQSAQNSIYLGMWSVHFIDDDEDYSTTHNLLGIVYKGYYAGTFLNSHEERAYSAGFQRDVYSTNWDFLSVDTGYRLGILYGYDDFEISDTKLFPLLQLYVDVSYKSLGVQFSWAGTVFTAGFFIRF